MGVIDAKLPLVQVMARRRIPYLLYGSLIKANYPRHVVACLSFAYTLCVLFFLGVCQLFPCRLTIDMNVCSNRPVPFAPIMITF